VKEAVQHSTQREQRQGLGFRVLGFQDFRFGVSGIGFRVQG
jgi:hypothetical protein